MKVQPKYYFITEDTNDVIHLNECYHFILKEFDSEEDAMEALNTLGRMFEESFGRWDLDFSLELRTKYVYKTCWGSS